MNTDIRLSVEFWDHPKTVKLERRLGLEGVKALQVLWAWAAKNKPDGVLSGMDEEDIEIAAGWKGNDGELLQNLIELRWVDKGASGYALHDWKDHNDWAAKVEDREDRGRFSRLKQVAPNIHKMLSEQGVTAISKEYYDSIVAERRPTPGVSPGSAQGTPGVSPGSAQGTPGVSPGPAQGTPGGQPGVQPAPGPAPGPAPVPAPVPAPSTTPPISPPRGKTEAEAETKTQAQDRDPLAENSSEDGEGARSGTRRNGKGAEYTADFEAFFAVYPRRLRKQEAFATWKKRKREGVDVEAVLAAATAYGKAMAYLGKDPDVILHPKTFLNENRWEDWLPPDGSSYLEAREIAKRKSEYGRDGRTPPVIEPTPSTYEEAKALMERKERERGGPTTYEEAKEALNARLRMNDNVIDADFRHVGDGGT